MVSMRELLGEEQAKITPTKAPTMRELIEAPAELFDPNTVLDEPDKGQVLFDPSEDKVSNVYKPDFEDDRVTASLMKDLVIPTAKDIGQLGVATAETAMQLGSGVLLYLPSKMYGLMALPWGREAMDMAEEHIASLGYQPYSEQGKQAGELIAKGFDAFLTPARMAGEAAEGIDPRLGYLVEFGAELAEFGMTGAMVGRARSAMETRGVNRAIPNDATIRYYQEKQRLKSRLVEESVEPFGKTFVKGEDLATKRILPGKEEVPLERAGVGKEKTRLQRGEDKSLIEEAESGERAFPEFKPKVEMEDSEVKAYFNKVDAAKRVTLEKMLKQGKRLAGEKFIDEAGFVKEELIKKVGFDGYKATINKILTKGRSGQAQVTWGQMHKDVWSGMPKKDIKLMDRYIFSKRWKEILKNDRLRGEPGKHTSPNKLSEQRFEKQIEGIESARPDIVARSDKYFDWMRRMLGELRKEDLINNDLYNELLRFDYSRMAMIDAIDPKTQTKLGRMKEQARDSGIDTLAKGKASDLLETDSQMMAIETISRTYGRVFSNRANKSLYEAAQNIDNPIVKIKKPGKGWDSVKVFIEGEQRNVYMPTDLARNWNMKNTEVSYALGNAIRFASMSSVLRPMATGKLNPLYGMINFIRDIPHIWTVSQYYDNNATNFFTGKKGQWKSTYHPASPVALKQIGVDLANVASDTFSRKGRYLEAAEDGMLMEFLGGQQGSILKQRMGKHPREVGDIGRFFLSFNENMEIWTRLMLRERAIKNRAREKGISVKEASKNTEIRREASALARDYMDFSQYGTFIKVLDEGVPYTNAAIQGTRGIAKAMRRNPAAASSKIGQLAILSTTLYAIGKEMAPQNMIETSEETLKRNFIIQTPDSWRFKDIEGIERGIYFKIPKDQSQIFFGQMFNAMYDKSQGNEVDVGKVIKDMKEFFPDLAIWPSAESYFGYTRNVDFWNEEQLFTAPGYKITQQIGPLAGQEVDRNSPQLYKDLGKTTGLSPVRSKYAVERLTTRDNPLVFGMTQAYESAFGEAPEINRQEHLAKTLSEIPFLKRFLGVTSPYHDFVEEKEELQAKVSIDRWVRTTNTDRIIKGHLYYDNQTYQEVVKEIKKNSGGETKELRRLFDRYKFAVTTKDIPYREFILSIYRADSKVSAQLFYDKYIEAPPVEQHRMLSGASRVMGKGFKEEFGRLVGEGRSE